MQVRIRRRDCCGTGACVEIAPDVFVIDSQQKATILDPEAVPLETLIEAAEACPNQAIVIEDDGGNQVFP